MNVLLSSVGRRNYLVQYFREAIQGRGEVYVADLNPYAPATCEADRCFTLPPVTAPDYFESLLDVCLKHDVRLLLSLNDIELPLLARQRERFEDAGVCVAVSSSDVLHACTDKVATAKFLQTNRLPVPATFSSLEDTYRALSAGKIDFPLVIKARWGSASIGLGFADNLRELDDAYRQADRQVRDSILAGLQDDPGFCLVVQPSIKGKEFNLDIVNDLEGKYHATLAKQKLGMRGGETDEAVTVVEPELQRLGAMLGECLGHVGNLDCDVMWGSDGPTIIDLNPRFGGGYPFAHAAGARVERALLAWVNGDEIDPKWLQVVPGVRSAKCARLISFPPPTDTVPERVETRSISEQLSALRQSSSRWPISKTPTPARLYLSPPHMSPHERKLLLEAFDSNWIAPLGPHVNAFEQEFAEKVGAAHAVALSSGTAGLHLALLLQGVGPGDEVATSSLTFAASANAIRYVGAKPVFIDSEPQSWNLDPELLAEELEAADGRGKPIKAVLAVDVMGQCADYEAILKICRFYDVPLIEDAAESLGATYNGRAAGTFGDIGCFSFNGNKIITTSGGGMLVTENKEWADRARFLATQARDPAPHYEHSELGYNYRLSNLLAAVGRGQLRVLDERVQQRRANFQFYHQTVGELPGVAFMPELENGHSTRWLSCLLIDPDLFGATREDIRLALEQENIESRPVWKPMHLQPAFADCRVNGGEVSEQIFQNGLCLPSGSNLSKEDLTRVVEIVRRVHRAGTVSTRYEEAKTGTI